MRLLLINYEFPPIGAGAATASYNIGKCLVQEGHEVFVLTSCFENLKGWSIEDGIHIYRCRAIRKDASQSNLSEMLSFVLSAFFVIPRLLVRIKIEAIIVFFSFPCGPLGLWGKLISRKPYVISLRGGDVPGNEPALDIVNKILQPMRRLILRQSLAIIANSKGLGELSKKADPFSVKVIFNGVDTDFFIPASKMTHQTRFLFVGRFREQKNLFFLLEQIDIVAKEVTEEFELHLIGAGPLEYSLKKYASKLSMHGRIFWHGWCDKFELRKHYQNAYCVLNPSLYEGMPNVVLEAMSCGIPVIASNVPGNGAVIRHGQTGFLFDLLQPEEFRKYIVKITENEDLAEKMGQESRALVEKEFSWDKTAKEYIQLIKETESFKKEDLSSI